MDNHAGTCLLDKHTRDVTSTQHASTTSSTHLPSITQVQAFRVDTQVVLRTTSLDSTNKLEQWLIQGWCNLDQDIINMATD